MPILNQCQPCRSGFCRKPPGQSAQFFHLPAPHAIDLRETGRTRARRDDERGCGAFTRDIIASSLAKPSHTQVSGLSPAATSIRLATAAGAFGTTMVSSPFLSSAFTWAASAWSGRVKLRLKLPNDLSKEW